LIRSNRNRSKQTLKLDEALDDPVRKNAHAHTTHKPRGYNHFATALEQFTFARADVGCVHGVMM
jgi:hypothetical protein